MSEWDIEREIAFHNQEPSFRGEFSEVMNHSGQLFSSHTWPPPNLEDEERQPPFLNSDFKSLSLLDISKLILTVVPLHLWEVKKKKSFGGERI